MLVRLSTENSFLEGFFSMQVELLKDGTESADKTYPSNNRQRWNKPV